MEDIKLDEFQSSPELAEVKISYKIELKDIEQKLDELLGE